jgi:hypothetical protein
MLFLNRGFIGLILMDIDVMLLETLKVGDFGLAKSAIDWHLLAG